MSNDSPPIVALARVKLEKARQRLLEQQIATAEETLVPREATQRYLDESMQVIIAIFRGHFAAAAPAMANQLGIDESEAREFLAKMVEEEIARLPKPNLDALFSPPAAPVRTPRGPRTRPGRPPKPKR